MIVHTYGTYGTAVHYRTVGTADVGACYDMVKEPIKSLPSDTSPRFQYLYTGAKALRCNNVTMLHSRVRSSLSALGTHPKFYLSFTILRLSHILLDTPTEYT